MKKYKGAEHGFAAYFCWKCGRWHNSGSAIYEKHTKEDRAKLSVVVITRNEENNIAKCLESVKWADEIVVVDSLSTDRTVEIARRYTDKVFSIEREALDANINKNFGMEKATGDWILTMDADEIVMPEFRAEVEGILRNDDGRFNGYFMLRRCYFIGKWLRHGGWYEYAAKLIRRGKGRWPLGMHRALEVDGELGCMRNPIVHNCCPSILGWVDKMNEYTTVEAGEMERKGTKFKASRVLLSPPAVFLKQYFSRRGCMDGFHGFMAAILASCYEFMRHAKLWEKSLGESNNSS